VHLHGRRRRNRKCWGSLDQSCRRILSEHRTPGHSHDLPPAEPDNFPGRDDNLTPVAANWAGITFDNDTAGYATVSGSITGDLTGPVTANKVVRIEVGDDLQAAITATAYGESIGYVEFAESTAAGTINAQGDIHTIRALASGVLAGAITAGGHITLLEAAGDIAIVDGGIKAVAGIDLVNVAADILGSSIDASWGTTTGVLHSLRAENFSGLLHAGHLHDTADDGSFGVRIDGDFDGVLVIEQDAYGDIVVGGGFAAETMIQIGGNLRSWIVAEGSIPSLEVVGDLAAAPIAGGGLRSLEIRSETGSIGTITVGGSITSDTNNPGYEISIFAQEFIGSIVVGGDLFARIRASDNTRVPIGTIQVGQSAAIELMCESFDTIDVREFLHITNQNEFFEIGTFPSGSLIRCGYSLGVPIHVTEEGGFDGQIIVGAAGGGIWSWVNDILFQAGNGAEAFAPVPYYAQLTGYHGTGAVGLVPYALHADDCDPPHSPAGNCAISFPMKAWPTTHGGGTRQTIILRHYGPVFDSLDDYGDPDDPLTHAVLVQVQSLAICNPTPCPGIYGVQTNWYEPNDFDVYTPGNGSREVWIARKLDGSTPQAFSLEYKYQVVLEAMEEQTTLRCDKTFLEPEEAPNVIGYPYLLYSFCESLTNPPEE
jgi:hypothetical protein